MDNPELLLSIIEGFAVPQLGVNLSGAIVLVNASAEALLGYDRQELIGKPIEVLVPERIRTAHPSFREAYAGEPTTRSMGSGLDLTCVAKSGEEIPVEIGLNPLTLGDELIVLSSIVDVRPYKEQQARLHEAIETQRILAREVHHRVKNNLQLVSSLLSMQARTVPDTETKNVLAAAQSRVHAIGLVHDMLYRKDGAATTLDFADYVRALLSNIGIASGPAIHIEQSIAGAIDMDLDTAVPCGLILQELLSNASKHAFDPEQREPIVSVELSATDDTVTIRVSDNGRGIDSERPGGLGLKLARALARQVRGTLTVSNECGTHWRLECPRMSGIES